MTYMMEVEDVAGWCRQVFCLEQPGRDGKFYRGFAAADYAGLWAYNARAQQRHFYEARASHSGCSLAQKRRPVSMLAALAEPSARHGPGLCTYVACGILPYVAQIIGDASVGSSSQGEPLSSCRPFLELVADPTHPGWRNDAV